MDTRGWDVIYIISRAVATADMQKNMSKLMTTFDWSFTSQGASIDIKGNFGLWSIAETGSTRYIQIDIPIVSGSATQQPVNGDPSIIDISNVMLTMQFELAFVDGVVPDQKQLAFNVHEVGTIKDASKKSGVVATIDVNCNASPEARAAPWFKGVFHDEAPKLFLENRSKLSYVFASVNLVASGSSSWMAPKSLTYSYWGSGDGYLCVLTKTTKVDVSNFPLDPDSSLFDTNHEIFVGISQEMFLRYMILPSLGSSYQYQNVKHSSGGMEIGKICNNGNISLPSDKQGAVTYYPEITSFEMIVENNQLKTNAEGRFDFHMPNAWVSFKCSLTNTFQYSGGQISFPVTSNNHDYSTHIPWYDYILGGGIGAIVVAAVSNAVGSGIADDVSRSMGSVSTLDAAVVSWGSTTDVIIEDVELSQSLFLKCKTK